MNSIGHRLVSCFVTGAIFTFLALVFMANSWIVALVFVLGSICSWITADPQHLIAVCKNRFVLMRAECSKRKTPYQKRMQRLERCNTASGALWMLVWLGQSITFALLLAYVISPDTTGVSKGISNPSGLVIFGGSWFVLLLVLSASWLFLQVDPYSKPVQGYKKTIQDIRAFRLSTSRLLSHQWVVFYTLRLISCSAKIVKSVLKTIPWFLRHFVQLLKSAHTNERLVYTISVVIGMLAGFYTGSRTDSIALGTCVGGMGGALVAWLDWHVFSVLLRLRDKVPVSD
jgi:hypothetical protein